MTFSIVECKIKQIKDPVKYVEVQNINPGSINNFKNSIATLDLLSQLDLNVRANLMLITIYFLQSLSKLKLDTYPKKFNVLIVVSIVLNHG